MSTAREGRCGGVGHEAECRLGRVRRLAPLLAVLALAGCGDAGGSGAFEGEEQRVADVVEGFQTAAQDRDEGRICRGLLAPDVARQLGDCERAIGEVIDAADTTDLNVEDVALQGSDRARARVRAGRDEDTDRVITLVRTGDGWRIADLGEPAAA